MRECGHAHHLGQQSPGDDGAGLLHLEATIAKAFEQGQQRFDLLAPRHDYKMEFADGVMGVSDYSLAVSPLGRLYVDLYVARTGLDPRPALPAYLAYNFFRIAAILQGIIGRVRDGTATSDHAPAKAAMIRPLAATAWRFAQEAGAK